MNHPAPGGLEIAAAMVVGCAWATLVTFFWPRPHPPAITPTRPARAPDPADARLAAGNYAIGFAVAAIAATVAVRTSRWYAFPAGTALVVLLISGVAGRQVFQISFAERLLETAIGAGLALTFGVAFPAAVREMMGSEPTGWTRRAQ
jgi:hypothetical protein